MARKPEGFLGKVMLFSMNSFHGKMADWGIAQLPPDLRPAEVADVGCGGGRNAAKLLNRWAGVHVTAVDYAPLSVEKAEAYNKKDVAAGRCQVLQGDVSHLELPPESCDLVTAFETVYFWPGLEGCFEQICQVLKPGGLVLIVNQSDGEDEVGQKWERIIDGMKIYTAWEIRQALQAAGFSWVDTRHHPVKPWIAVLARK
jgi:SAM-dependent methyltransferase